MNRTVRATWAMCALIALAAAAPVHAHDAIPPPGTSQEQATRYAFNGGVYAPAERAPMIWFEHKFPGGSGTSNNPFKLAFGRAMNAWNRLGRDFHFRSSGNQEVTATSAYRALVRGSEEANPEDTDRYKKWCGETRDDPTQPGLNPIPLNLVYWAKPSRLALAEALMCYRLPPGSHLLEPYKFALAFDRVSREWWPWPGRRKGSGTTFDDSQTDFQAVATHELGHAAGFAGHFPEGGVKTSGCSNTSTDPAQMCRTADCSTNLRARETMCEGIDGGADTIYLRSLGSHDKHTFLGAYPNAR